MFFDSLCYHQMKYRYYHNLHYFVRTNERPFETQTKSFQTLLNLKFLYSVFVFEFHSFRSNKSIFFIYENVEQKKRSFITTKLKSFNELKRNVRNVILIELMAIHKLYSLVHKYVLLQKYYANLSQNGLIHIKR